MPPAIAFLDVNGTLLDPATIDRAGAPDGTGSAALDLAVWQATSDTLVGRYRPLPEYVSAAVDGDERLVRAASKMEPFPDSADGLRRLGAAGVRPVALTNSARESAEEALDAAGLLEHLELVIGSDEIEAYKPDARVYRHGLERAGVQAPDAVLVAAHWWDVLGAASAGLRTAFVARPGKRRLATAPEPDFAGDDVAAAAEAIAAS